MSKTEQELINEAIRDLVDRIFERGRVDARTNITVKDGGPEMAKIRFVNEIKTLARTEAISLADKIIGKDVPIRQELNNIMEEHPVPKAEDEAVRSFQAKQRLKLAEYHNPQPKVQYSLDIPLEKQEADARNFRVDRSKNALDLESDPGTSELSLNEG